jgi:hypothetical protein
MPQEDEKLQTFNNTPIVDAYISKFHITNLWKQHVAWKPHNQNSPMWVFLNEQPTHKPFSKPKNVVHNFP